jgi:pilus assembly protein Flp/PilA
MGHGGLGCTPVEKCSFCFGLVSRVLATSIGPRTFSENVMKKFVNNIKKFLKSEDGPTAVEYAVMLALIVIVCLTAIQAIGQNASNAFNDIAADINDARTGTVN